MSHRRYQQGLPQGACLDQTFIVGVTNKPEGPNPQLFRMFIFIIKFVKTREFSFKSIKRTEQLYGLTFSFGFSCCICVIFVHFSLFDLVLGHQRTFWRPWPPKPLDMPLDSPIYGLNCGPCMNVECVNAEKKIRRSISLQKWVLDASFNGMIDDAFTAHSCSRVAPAIGLVYQSF